MEQGRWSGSMLQFAILIFAGAFLLLQVQPLLAKAILPWFGGAATVWTSCLLFFQVLLLGGYAYAHWLAQLPAARQQQIHAALLTISLLTLPVRPNPALAPQGGEPPLGRLMWVLTTAVGVPYLVLAANGPLLQSWYARRFGRLPYRLFALSNAGSLAALLSYPLLVEPYLRVAEQIRAWSTAYATLVAGGLWLVWREGRSKAEAPLAAAGPDQAAPALPDRLFWLLLPACASALLLTVTHHLTENVAAVPLLWVLPLAIYLLSFIVAFDSPRWYHRPWAPALAALALIAMAYPFWNDLEIKNIRASVAAYGTGLFLCCWFCHGETARRQPPAHWATSFYLTVAAGGALGGFAVNVLAPVLLPYNFDFSLSLALLGTAGTLTVYGKDWWLDVLWTATAIFLAVTVYRDISLVYRNNLAVARNFYGALRVRESAPEGSSGRLRTLVHGAINHGAQFLDERRSRLPTTYYGERSGVGLAIRDRQRPGMRVGIIGLGAGTLAAYVRPQDHYKIYEINAQVVQFADTWFTYLRLAPEPVEIVLGDARLSLEREAPNGFDVLAVDAFSSDAIPVHLLTRQAMALYFRHLRDDGLLALHISNHYLDLYPVIQRAAESLGKTCALIQNPEDPEKEQFSADWALVSSRADAFRAPAFRAAVAQPANRQGPLWTDDYSHLWSLLR